MWEQGANSFADPAAAKQAGMDSQVGAVQYYGVIIKSYPHQCSPYLLLSMLCGEIFKV